MNREEKVLKKGFEAGATMAFLSLGKFEKDEEESKLKEVIDKLYSEFINIFHHSKESKENRNETKVD